MIEGLKVIAFDADDTLWENEGLFREAERNVAEELKEYGDHDYISSELYKTEFKNMGEYGFGAKAYVLSMVETAVRISDGKVSGEAINKILDSGRKIMANPATPYPGVRETLETLKQSGKYRLVMFTKGDLLDQERKACRSGLEGLFERIVVISDKTSDSYQRLLSDCKVKPEEFMMIGNSFKSDIDPVLKLGGYGIFIPSKVLWQLEHTEEYSHSKLYKVSEFKEILPILCD